MEKSLKVLIVDDTQIWLREGQRILEGAGYSVETLLVAEPQKLQDPEWITQELSSMLSKTDILLTDKDLGDGLDSTVFCCVARKLFPELPIIRWTGGYERSGFMGILGVTAIDKPTKPKMDEFPKVFSEALCQQAIILGGATTILEEVLKKQADAGEEKKSSHAIERRAGQIRDLEQISQLAEDGVDMVPVLDEYGKRQYDRYEGGYRHWTIEGREAGVLMHELGHAICDGELGPEEIKPFLPALKKVVQKLETDERFQTCAEFLLAEGPAEEVILIKGCY